MLYKLKLLLKINILPIVVNTVSHTPLRSLSIASPPLIDKAWIEWCFIKSILLLYVIYSIYKRLNGYYYFRSRSHDLN